MDNKQTTTIRILALALLVALLAIVALSFALCSKSNATPSPASSASSVSHTASDAASPTPAQASAASSQWDEVTDDEPAASASSPTADAAQPSAQESTSPSSPTNVSGSIDETGTYTSKDEVALYLHTYGHLPSNYISKSKAKKAGWVASKGNLDKVLPGMSIGGSEFYNNEGQLPDAPGRTWTECDINYSGGFRGAERIVFSNDGLIFYTGDHYETFEQLY